MLKFYFSGAPNPTKVALFLEEAGLPYEAIPVDTRRGEQHKPEYLAINPNAKVPAIVDGDVIVFDSNAINGEPHLMVARGTPIDPNSCVASLRKPFDARDFHHFTAAARRPFSRASHQQTLKYRHCLSSAEMLGPPGSLLEGYFVRHSC